MEKPRTIKKYKDIPYTISFYKPTSQDDATKWSSIIQPMETSVAMVEKAINNRQRQIDIYSWMPLVATHQGDPITLDTDAIQLVNMNPGETIQWPVWPGNSPDVNHQISFMTSKVSQSGFSDVMYGEGASGVSGYALSQLGDQSRIRLEQPITHLSKLWTWWGRKVIDLTLAFAPEALIHIYGSAKGESFAETMDCANLDSLFISCEIKPEFPNEKVRKHAMATQARGLGLSESTTMQEYLDVQQPDQERKKRIMETAQQHPAYMQYWVMWTLKEMADDGDPIAQMMLSTMAQQGVPTGAGGRPQEPNKPEQPLGLQSSTGEAPIQATQNIPQAGMSEQDVMQRLSNAAPNMSGGVLQ